MYKKIQNRQAELTDFNQPLGFKINPLNRWVIKASTIPWDAIEERYASLFPSHTGPAAKPLRMALGSLLIQKKYGLSDRELVEEIKENPYLQFFIGLPGYRDEAPFVPSLLVEFRKRLNEKVLAEINEMIIEFNKPTDPPPKGGKSSKKPSASDDSSDSPSKDQPCENRGTLIVDATCAPQNIRFPQDVNILNEGREKLENIICSICYVHNLYRPRMYRRNARKDYLNFARSRKKTLKKIRNAIKKQLSYIKRDLDYIRWLADYGYEADDKQKALIEIIEKVYEQQKYMYDNRTHTVPHRIVSISQPFIRPIIRGKAAADVEFGAKLDLSIVDGLGRIEKLSFEAYNESEILKDVIDRYYQREGHYPERVLADKIYRNRANLQYCKSKGIRLSGPSLGRPKKDPSVDKRTEYIDNADCVEVERAFSLSKRSFGMGLIRTRLEGTTRSSIALSIIAMNIDKLAKAFLCQKTVLEFSRYNYGTKAGILLFIPHNHWDYRRAA